MVAQSIQDELVVAAAHGDVRQISSLLEQGADINGAGGAGGYWTPLTCATENGQLGVIRLLVSRGAKLDEAITDAGTPLHVAIDNALDGAIQSGTEVDWQGVALLLDLGADLHTADRKGKTPLDLVAAYGDRAQREFAEFLERFPQGHDDG
jgi:ankyrin repeat protein